MTAPMYPCKHCGIGFVTVYGLKCWTCHQAAKPAPKKEGNALLWVVTWLAIAATAGAVFMLLLSLARGI